MVQLRVDKVVLDWIEEMYRKLAKILSIGIEPTRCMTISYRTIASKTLDFASANIHTSSLQVSEPSDSVKPAEIIPMGIAITAIPQIAVKDAMIFPNAVTGYVSP